MGTFHGVKGAYGVATRCATRTLDPAPLPPILLPAIRTTDQATREPPKPETGRLPRSEQEIMAQKIPKNPPNHLYLTDN